MTSAVMEILKKLPGQVKKEIRMEHSKDSYIKMYKKGCLKILFLGRSRTI